jgi:hypothetical protein
MFSIKVDRKFQLLGVDLYSVIPKGSVTNYDTILVMTDFLTKWVVAVPIKDASATTVAEAIYNNWIIHYGVPEEIISDEGGEFNAKAIHQELYEVCKIKKLTTTSYHQQTNGQCERFNRTMSGMLAKYTKDDQTKWDIYLPTCVLEYNNTIHSVTKESPHFMVFGQESRIPIDLVIRKDEIDALNPSIGKRTAMAVKRIRENQYYNKVKYDKKRTNETFKRGDFVLWRQEPRTNMALDEHAKLISPWYGPVTIFKDIGQNKYIIIDDEANPKTINVENLKKYQKRPDWMKDDVPEEMEVDGNIIVSPAVAPSVEDKGKDIPAMAEPIINPKEVQAESMDVEMPTNVRRSTREKKYVPKKDDKIDMRFYDTKDKKKYWSCGTVIKIDKEDKNRIYFKFLDETNEDWYDLRDEDLEIRRCIQSSTHNRSAVIKILNIQESAQNPKESEEKRKKRRIRQKEGVRAQRKKTKTNG